MKALLLSLILLTGGDRDRGLQLYAEGRFQEAAQAFQQAIETEGDSAELSYNLALALWRAGDQDGAETAAERAATLSDGHLRSLRDGILGALRYDVARQTAEQDPAAALPLAEQARDHFLRGGLDQPSPQLHRNLERALRLIEELKEKMEEQEQEQQEQEQKGEEQNQQNQQNQRDEQNQKEEEQRDEEQQEQQQQPEEQEQQEQQQERNDAPGEQETAQLTPEQKQRMMEQLEQMEEALRELRALRQSSRPRVGRDW